MRYFRFESIWMLSRRERTALQISFAPGKNLVYGPNHVGKSTLTKNLFVALGAIPEGELAQWDNNVVSLVDFVANDVRFRALHMSGMRALFDKGGKLIAATAEDSEWKEIFAAHIGFNLPVSNKRTGTSFADPASFFLPFYINQDGSWLSRWATFHGHQPVQDIIDYFAGLKSPEYYEIKSNLDYVKAKYRDANKENTFLLKARDRVLKKHAMIGPKLELSNFKKEIAALTEEVTKLNVDQEKLREDAVSTQELITSIAHQVKMTANALQIYEKDYDFIKSHVDPVLVCPVCHAEHEKSFMDLLSYAEDARVLRELDIRLKNDEKDLRKHLQMVLLDVNMLEEKHKNIRQLLSVKRGQLKLEQVLDGIGSEKAFQAFDDERIILNQIITGYASQIEKLKGDLKPYTDKDRKKNIISDYRYSYNIALKNLNISVFKTDHISLYDRPGLAGSGGPRSTLAYYAALWSVCFGEYGAFSMPIIIDAPNQQGQDEYNLPVVMDFIFNKLPKGSQLIVASETDNQYKFDKKIHFAKKYQVLNKESYDAVYKEIKPLEEAAFDEINSKLMVRPEGQQGLD